MRNTIYQTIAVSSIIFILLLLLYMAFHKWMHRKKSKVEKK